MWEKVGTQSSREKGGSGMCPTYRSTLVYRKIGWRQASHAGGVFIAVWPCFVAGKATLDCLGSLSAAHTALLSGGHQAEQRHL